MWKGFISVLTKWTWCWEAVSVKILSWKVLIYFSTWRLLFYLLLITLTFYWHPTLRWEESWMFTLVETFIWLWHSWDYQFLSDITLEEFTIFVERETGIEVSSEPWASESNGLSLHHRMDRALQDNTIWICKQLKKHHNENNLRIQLVYKQHKSKY